MMNNRSDMTCKKLTVVQRMKDGTLSIGKLPVSFHYKGYQITVEDCVVRTVVIESQVVVNTEDLLSIFFLLNQVCMICDGSFIDIYSISFDDTQKSVDELKLLSFYFNKSDFYGSSLLLINSIALLSSELMDEWEKICSELIFPHNAFLYMTSLAGLPIDIRIAYMAECFEPLSAYIANKRSKIIPQQDKKSYLFSCLSYVVSEFGDECFSGEKAMHKQDDRIEQIANTRHRLMHLKKDFEGELLKDRNEMVAYARKLHLLYRHTLLQLMGVDKSKYLSQLKYSVENADKYLVETHQNGGGNDE